MIAHITNNEGKYTTWLVDTDFNRLESIQLCDRDIPFSKYEVVEVLTDGQWVKKRLMNRTDSSFYFDDETEALIEDNITRSTKTPINTGYYKGSLLNFYFDPTGKKKTVQGMGILQGIIINDELYSRDNINFSHSYFKIESQLDIKNKQLN